MSAPEAPTARLLVPLQTWIVAVAVVVFAAHAACYLYFFVDDEAIPLVYARHLLEGKGLVYTSLEGRVEGYSDFLHVLWNTGLLALTRVMGLRTLEALAIGKAVSFALAINMVLLTARIMRNAGIAAAGVAAGLSFLVLAGPLAVWSCSSLEAVPFAFALTALAVTILPGMPATRRYVPAALACVILLERLDGFVYLGALLLGAIAGAEPARRRTLFRTVALPSLAMFCVYHAARYAYFGSLLSTPLEAKVLYELIGDRRLVVKAPHVSYLRGFVDLYGILVLPVIAVVLAAAWRSRTARAAAIAATVIAIYVQVVGDWMFGWRFVVPLLPFAAIAIAVAVSRGRPTVRWALAAAAFAWSVFGAQAFARTYRDGEQRPFWWTSPHLGDAAWLAPYGDLIRTARTTIARGDVIAYNQAGLVPFVLDVENIDDLGICSKFEAELPTTDVFFTQVGRYTPLTNAPIFNAPHAYLLYRDVRVLISRTDLLSKANGGHIPEELLGGFFRLAATDPSGANALYRRTGRDASEYRRDPSLFWQNLAHTSRIRRVDVDGALVPDADIGSQLPYLRSQMGTVTVSPRTRIDIRFSDRDEDVHAIYAETVSAHPAVALTLNLYDTTGRLVASEQAQPDSSPAQLLRRYPSPVRARMLSIEAAASSSPARLSIVDLRVEGQSAALAAYVRQRLRFPPPE